MANPLIQGYLAMYNLLSAFLWAAVLYKVAFSLYHGEPTRILWLRIYQTLALVQTMAAVEIVHAALRIVRSPLFVTFIQVNSRLIVLWGYTWWAPACHQHWSLPMMVGAWALTEVPRYLYYTFNLFPMFQGPKMPYALFWLRYSLFIVLYPMGITGEVLQIYVACTTFLGRATMLERAMVIFPLFAYIPGSPYMILNMWNNRRGNFKKLATQIEAARAKKESGKADAPLKKPAPQGLVWPVTNEATGDRSTSQTNQELWAAAVAPVDAEAAAAVRKTRGWRFGYARHVEAHVRAALRSPGNAVKIAEAGLKAAHKAFRFERDGKSSSFAEAMAGCASGAKGFFETGFLRGEGRRGATECRVNYKGEALTGARLEAQLDAWVEAGTVEPSAAAAIKEVAANPEWMDLSDMHFVLLGATSAMGPLDLLLQCGANIIAIDIDRPAVWERLFAKVRSSPGTITFPLRTPQQAGQGDAALAQSAGANLLTHAPEIAAWLCGACPGKRLTVGNYTYLDGALHVQLSVACDAIMQQLCAARRDTAIAFLCTPTDVHNVSREAYEAARANYKAGPGWQKLLEKLCRAAGLKQDLVPNVLPPAAESGLFLTDGIAVRQGPNYALAKRMQHWRVVVAREEGHTVSSNVAPSTSTVSVTSNPLFAAAYKGFCLFAALEVMAPETSSSAMLALLINDLRNDKSAANPKVKLDNPMQLFAENAFHGGSFRCPYKIGSIGTVSVLYFFLTQYGLLALPVLGAMAASAKYVLHG